MSAAQVLVPDAWRPGALHASWRFDGREPRSAGLGRSHVRMLLDLWHLSARAELVSDLGVITSELITNVVRHADTSTGMCALSWGEGLVTVWVHDRGPGMPRPLPVLKPREGSDWDWHGAGIPLIQGIAAIYDGSVSIQKYSGGLGKSVCVQLRVNASAPVNSGGIST